MSKVQEQPIDGLIATLWANQQGYVVRNEVGALVADVCDDMLHDWVAVCCYEHRLAAVQVVEDPHQSIALRGRASLPRRGRPLYEGALMFSGIWKAFARIAEAGNAIADSMFLLSISLRDANSHVRERLELAPIQPELFAGPCRRGPGRQEGPQIRRSRMTQKLLDRMLVLSEGLTPEECAKLAGSMMEYAGVSRSTFILFCKELTETNREEFLDWMVAADEGELKDEL